MPSPTLMAAALARRTSRAALVVLGSCPRDAKVLTEETFLQPTFITFERVTIFAWR